MKELKYETKTTHIIDYNNWDNFIHKNFSSCPYGSIVYEEGMNNYSTFSCEPWDLSEKEKKDTVDYLNGKLKGMWFGGTGQIISHLVEEKVLPEGYYNIKVFW